MYTGEQESEFEPGTVFGPVEAYLHTADFVTVLVGGSWINVWKYAECYSPENGYVGIDFANRLEPEAISGSQKRQKPEAISHPAVAEAADASRGDSSRRGLSPTASLFFFELHLTSPQLRKRSCGETLMELLAPRLRRQSCVII